MPAEATRSVRPTLNVRLISLFTGESQKSQKLFQNPPKSTLGPPKSSPEASKTPFLKDLSLKNVKEGNRMNSKMEFGAKLTPSWSANTFQNRCQNTKKSISKNNTFSTSIFTGFDPRFGSFFERFFGSKMHADSETKKSVQQAKNTVKTNAKLMSALVQQNIFQTKFCGKLHVFWDVDFGRLLKRFWKGLGKPKSLISAVFSM